MVAESSPGSETETAPAARHDAIPQIAFPDWLESPQPVAHPALGPLAEAPSAEVNPPIPIAPSHESAEPAMLERHVKEYRGLQRPPTIERTEIAGSKSGNGRSAAPFRPSLPPGVSPPDTLRHEQSSVVAAGETDKGPGPGGVPTPEVEWAGEPDKNRPAGVGENTSIPRSQAARPDGAEVPAVVIEPGASPEKAFGPTIAGAEPRPIRTAPTFIAQPSVAPHVKPAAPRFPEPLEAPQPAPTIQVTIGRIEVRATSPVTAPEKRGSTPPVMSLGEFLNQRARKGSDR